MHPPLSSDEHVLPAAKETFRTFADALPCIVLAASRDGTTEYLNARGRELTGAPAEMPAAEAWLNALHPEDKSWFRRDWPRSIQAGHPFHMELRLWSQARNEHRWHILRARPQSSGAGEIVRWLATCEDTHDWKSGDELLRHSDAQLKMLIEDSPVGVVLMNPDGQPIYCNRKCIELRGQEVDWDAWSSVVHPSDREELIASWRAAAAQGLPWSARYRFIHPDGRMVWVSARSVPIRSGSDLLGFIRTLEDITEMKTAEEKLQKANHDLQAQAVRLESQVQERTAKLREALTELDKLSYSIVHDMRAPLRTMYGFATLLLQDHAERLDNQGKEYLDRIARAAQRQDRLIQDVLVYHRYVRDDFELAPVNLDQLVAGILETYAHLQPPRVDIRIQEPLGWVLAHETLLTQCVSALLDNAVKFVAEGIKPSVSLGTEKCASEVKLWVQDNGIGIAPETQTRLFDIFYKFHHPGEYPGTGIGLPLAKKAVERMEGRIGVESEIGQGSRFWIALKSVPGR
jgi:PAS domain S-box-containing protein